MGYSTLRGPMQHLTARAVHESRCGRCRGGKPWTHSSKLCESAHTVPGTLLNHAVLIAHRTFHR